MKIDKSDIIIEISGIGLPRKDFLMQKMKEHKELYRWFNRNYNIIEVYPTLKNMCKPIGLFFVSNWNDNLLDKRITKNDIGLSLFDFIKENRLNKDKFEVK